MSYIYFAELKVTPGAHTGKPLRSGSACLHLIDVPIYCETWLITLFSVLNAARRAHRAPLFVKTAARAWRLVLRRRPLALCFNRRLRAFLFMRLYLMPDFGSDCWHS